MTGYEQDILKYLATTRHSNRNIVIFLLRVQLGLTPIQIARVKWEAVTDEQGRMTHTIRLHKSAKNQSDEIKTFAMSSELQKALSCLLTESVKYRQSQEIIRSERGNKKDKLTASSIYNLFSKWNKLHDAGEYDAYQ